MPYDKTLVADDGEEFPYTESLADGTYHYRISVVWEERDGELVVSPWGSHLAFDDDGSWMRFSVPPSELYPNQDRLTETDLLHYLGFLSFVSDRRSNLVQTLSADEVAALYRRFVDETGFDAESKQPER